MMNQLKFEFASIKNTKEGQFATFKGALVANNTEIKINLSTYIEDELEDLTTVIQKAKEQAQKDFRKVLPLG